MTIQDVDALVGSLGLPYSYYQFPADTEQAPPFICWLFTGSHDFYVDGENYMSIRPLAIELYTDTRDFAKEAEIEAALKGAGLAYSVEPEYLDDERMHETIFTTEVLIDA